MDHISALRRLSRSCNSQAHEFGFYCRLCFESLSISTSVPYRQIWRHFRGGFCSALQGTDLELFLLAIQEADKRFCAKLKEAGELKKTDWRKGKPHKKRVRANGDTEAGDETKTTEAREDGITSALYSTAGASPAVNRSQQTPQHAANAPTRQISMDLTYGDDEDDSDEDYTFMEETFDLDNVKAVSNAANGAEQEAIITSYPSPFRVKEQSADSDTLFSISRPGDVVPLSASTWGPKTLWPVASPALAASTLPALVLPYAHVLEASGISTHEDFEGLRCMVQSQVDLDSFLASVYAVCRPSSSGSNNTRRRSTDAHQSPSASSVVYVR